MITLKTSVNIAPNQFQCCAKFDATHVLAAGFNTPIVGGDPSVYMYSWNGTIFTPLGSTDLSGGETTGSNLKVQGNFIYRDGSGWSTASGAGVGQVEWDGSAFINGVMLIYYPGMIGMDPNEYRGRVYGYDGDGTYMFVCGRTWLVVSFPPYVLRYKYTIDALQSSSGGSSLKKSLEVNLADCGNVICAFGQIYLCGSPTVKRFTYVPAPAGFTLTGTYANPGITCFHTSLVGDWLLGVSSGSTLSAYTQTMTLLSSINTGTVITGVSSSGGYIFVSHPTTTEVYTYDGVNYTLVDSAALGIEKAFII